MVLKTNKTSVLLKCPHKIQGKIGKETGEGGGEGYEGSIMPESSMLHNEGSIMPESSMKTSLYTVNDNQPFPFQ